MIKILRKSIFAGFLISIASLTFLKCENKTIGAFLFSLGLIGVILLDAYLYTGKIGYINSKSILFCVYILIGNLITAISCGYLFRLIYGPSTIMDIKLEKDLLVVFLDAIFCGVCIYLAVECFKASSKMICIVLPIMVFILGGGEHCIADAFYWAATDFSLIGACYLLIIILGNSLGSLITRFLQVGFRR